MLTYLDEMCCLDVDTSRSSNLTDIPIQGVLPSFKSGSH